MKRRFSYSLNHISVVAAALVLVIAMLVLSFLSVFYQGRIRSMYVESMLRQQSQFDSTTVSSFALLEHQLFQMGSYDLNVSVLNTTKDAQSFYRAKMALFNSLSNLQPLFPEVDGLFFYSPSADDYTPFTDAKASRECSVAIRTFLVENRTKVLSMKELYTKWQPMALEDGHYLVRMINVGNCVMGAWTSLDTLLSCLRSHLPSGYVYGIWHEDFLLQPASLFSDYLYDESARTGAQTYRAPSGETYMVYAYPTSYSDCAFVIFTPMSLLNDELTPIMKGGAVLTLVVILTVAALSLLTKKLMETPIRPMQRALTELQDGGGQWPELTTDSRCVEVQQLFRVLNGQLKDIRMLEDQLHEDELARSRLELQFLKAQLPPHFIINCLNTFSYLAMSPDDNDRDAAQRLIQTLSQHIRRSFVSSETISLAEEFAHVENYLELGLIRYPGSLRYEMSLPPECAPAQIPPMTLLTLCENALKHNLVMGEQLTVRVTAKLTSDRGNEELLLTCTDSGTGYPPEVLERCNHILDYAEDVKSGYHIGIYAIVKAMRLVYKDDASFVFSNEPDAGARVEIRLPHVTKEDL